MKILVTGADGFIGKNICFKLQENGLNQIKKVNRETPAKELKNNIKECDFIIHLAGINRPKNEEEFQRSNYAYTQDIINELNKNSLKTPIIFSSSIQAELDNAYGKSKKLSEELIVDYSKESGANYYIYRLPNVFGKWSKPNYNSFIATFCFNLLNKKKIQIHDPDSKVSLLYIDDLCTSIISVLKGNSKTGFLEVHPIYEQTVGSVAQMLGKFNSEDHNITLEDVGTGFKRALYATYVSFKKPSQFSYELVKHVDPRGTFSEFIKTKLSGQVSFFTANPGITRGGHYHHTKNEKFLILNGTALFKFKNIVTGESFEITISDSSAKVVETIPGWAHDITNVGTENLIVMLWANECFDQNNPDTYSYDLEC